MYIHRPSIVLALSYNWRVLARTVMFMYISFETHFCIYFFFRMKTTFLAWKNDLLAPAIS